MPEELLDRYTRYPVAPDTVLQLTLMLFDDCADPEIDEGAEGADPLKLFSDSDEPSGWNRSLHPASSRIVSKIAGSLRGNGLCRFVFIADSFV
jgi:hypothetical protein